MSRLESMQNFVAVVEAGSITTAADKLGLTVAAVSKRLKVLEMELGTRLLTRTTRQLAVTEAGQYYYQHCCDILDEIGRVEQHLQAMQGKLSGVLRINMPMTYGKNRLVKLLLRFQQHHPDVQLILHLDDALVDVASGEYDVVIRIGEQLEGSGLVARKLENAYLQAVASPSYLAHYGTPQTPEQLLEHACLIYTNVSQRKGWQFFDAVGNVIQVSVQGRFCANNGEVLKQAAIAGLGIAFLPDFESNDALMNGTLVRILPEYTSPSLAVYAVYPTRQFLPEKTRAVVAFLHHALQMG